jgi:uncharacterized protein (DUF1330 family)
MSIGYLFVEVESADAAVYEACRRAIPDIISVRGGRILVRSGDPQLLDGGIPYRRRVVVESERSPRATHLPLHRQVEIYAREDIDLSRSTLADMVGQVAELVRPLIDALSRYVMAGERVHGDDSEVPVLEPGLGRTRKARLWTYVCNGQPYG